MPRKLTYEKHESFAIITLDDGKVNTIERTWIEEWNQALKRIEMEKPRALLIRGREGIFSAGLDLKALPNYKPEELQGFIRDYEQAMRALFLLEIPVVAEVTGHALAGGAVLLLACDLRISDPSPKKIGLNETQIGITLPPFVLAMAQATLNPPYYASALQAGDIYTPEEAVQAGFLHELVPREKLKETALMRTARLAALPEEPYRLVKRYLRQRAMEGVPYGPMASGSSLAARFHGQ